MSAREPDAVLQYGMSYVENKPQDRERTRVAKELNRRFKMGVDWWDGYLTAVLDCEPLLTPEGIICDFATLEEFEKDYQFRSLRLRRAAKNFLDAAESAAPLYLKTNFGEECSREERLGFMQGIVALLREEANRIEEGMYDFVDFTPEPAKD